MIDSQRGAKCEVGYNLKSHIHGVMAHNNDATSHHPLSNDPVFNNILLFIR